MLYRYPYSKARTDAREPLALTVDSSVTNGRTDPDITVIAIRPPSASKVEAMGKSSVIARRDAQVANLVARLRPETWETIPSSFFVGLGFRHIAVGGRIPNDRMSGA
jgi:hypothetical protein